MNARIQFNCNFNFVVNELANDQKMKTGKAQEQIKVTTPMETDMKISFYDPKEEWEKKKKGSISLDKPKNGLGIPKTR